MSETESIAAVIVDAVKATTAPLVARMTALEARAAAFVPVPGPAGRDGRDGVDGKDAPVMDLADATAPLVARLSTLEARVAATETRGADLSPEEIASAFTELLRKELAIDPARMEKRVVYDANGRIARIVEEPVS